MNGGSGGSASTGSGTSGSSGSCTPGVVNGTSGASAPTSLSYEVVYVQNPLSAASQTPANIVNILNQEGAKGYRFVTTGYTLNTTIADILQLFFVKDGAAPGYTYESPVDNTDFITQSNAEGAKGYRYVPGLGDPDNASFYVKATGSTATWQYELSANTNTVPVGWDQASLNSQGCAGWLVVANVGGSPLYEKNMTSNAVYTYEVPAQPTDSTALLAQINSEGSRGYRNIIFNTYRNGVSSTASIYAKDTTQSATFSGQINTSPNFYQNGDLVNNPDSVYTGLVTDASNFGAKGGQLTSLLGTWTQYIEIYMVPGSNCRGALCFAFSFS